MTGNFRIKYLEYGCNFIEFSGVITVLIVTLILQFILHELPCPLCLLQRIGMLSVALGLLMNLRFGLRPSHYGMVMMGALYGSFVALRQIALHILPGTPGFGAPFLGLHLYTWSFIIFVALIICTTLMMSVDRQYLPFQSRGMHYKWLCHALFATLTLVIVINLVSIFFECGLSPCPDNPVQYKML